MKFNIKKIINFKFDEKNINKNKAVKILIYLLIAIIGFTLLSRFSDSLTVPRVTTAKASYEPFVQNIEAYGEITESREENISTVKEILIDYINVNAGSKVKKGEVLFKLNEDSLKKKISEEEKLVDEKNKTYNRALEDYNNQKEDIEKQISTEYNNMTDLNSKYEKASDYEEKEALRIQYEEAKEKYETLVNTKDDTLLTAKRSLEDTDCSDEVKVLNEEINKLKTLLQDKGAITAAKDAYITNVFIEAGGVTSEGVALTLADESSDFKFKTTISKNEKKYVSEGQEVVLKLTNSYDDITGLTIESISLNKEDKNQYDIVVNVPSKKAQIGESAKLNLVESNEKTMLCIPKDALNMGENKSYYVWVMEERETTLGSDTVATKREVKIKDKNDKYVAIEDNALGMNDEIIVSSNKTINEGERVRKGKN